jgi:hypothetical protein
VEEQTSPNDEQKLVWKSPKPDQLEVTVPLKGAGPGPVKVAVYQYGLPKPDRLAMESYDAAASLDRFTLSSGDGTALLTGTRLDQVAKARVDGIAFTPGALKRAGDSDQLLMNAARATADLAPGEPYTAHVDLKDGRDLDAPVTVDPPRPKVMLLSKAVQGSAASPLPPIQFGSQDDLPVNGRLVFFLKSSVPAAFPRDEKVELASADGSFHSLLSLTDGGLMLEDAATAVATLDPLTRFGSSAFGPVRIRPISVDGTTGDWLPLGTLVRMPEFSELRCPRAVSKPCLLDGANLFLATSIAATSSFDGATDVSPDFTGTELIVPHPANGALYLKLRDDPATVQTLNLPVTLLALPPASASPGTPAPSSPNPAQSPNSN